MAVEPVSDAFAQLCMRLGAAFDAIARARTRAAMQFEALRALAGNGQGLAAATAPIAPQTHRSLCSDLWPDVSGPLRAMSTGLCS